jgi:uncharacterized damage-inducible protein DinB
MRRILPAVLLVVSCSIAVLAQQDKSETNRTPSSVLDRGLSGVEKEFVSAAQAMPDDKYGYAPTQGEFKGVRTFSQQVRHVAAVNYMISAAILGEKPPVDVGGESGPETIKTKADIVKFLQDSFAYSHRAFGIINESNMVQSIKGPFGDAPATRLGLAALTIGHCFDHYGQMVEYLRSNGIVPPASRGQ